MRACDGCLRRGHLLGLLAPRVAALLDRPRTRVAELLALEDERLIAAVAGREQARARSFLETFAAERAREQMAQRGLRAVCRHDAEYPGRLRELADAPAVLFVASELERPLAGLDEPSVAVVGARRASIYGREVARELGRGLARVGVPTISGLALGIDGEVHRGTAAGEGLPVAVLAGGADVVYPRSHARLYATIVATGAVVSELPPGQRPLRWSFPARNRIMAGLATLTVVVEAAEGSGSLITCDFATDLQRTVAAVPGPVTASVAAGSNRLLRDGALLITGAQDVLEELYGVGFASGLTGPRAPDAPRPDADDERLLEALEGGLDLDRAAERAGLAAPEARVALSRLEASGLLRRDSLGGYHRSARAVGARGR